MKIKILLGLIAVLAFSAIGYAQTVTITPKKTNYTRKGKGIPKEKKTFTVTYPTIAGKLSPAVRRKLENTISYWKVFDTTLAENLGDYHWLSELSYEVNYNRNGILDIALTQEGVGAYPSTHTINLVVDLKNGGRIRIGDVFQTGSLGRLAKMVNQKLAGEKKEIISMIDKGEFSEGENDKELNDSLKEQISNLEFTEDNFDEFSVSDKGVTFIYDAGFPHVIRAAEPDGRYFFTWAELKPFIKPGGLLGKFVR